MSSSETVDVAIVGAGFAGLSAANYLSSKSIGCIVIEGRSRVGGRTLSEKIFDEKTTIDLGGQWIGPAQHRILSLVKRFNLDLIEQTWYHQKPNLLGELLGLQPLTDDQIEKVNEIYNQWDQMALEFHSIEQALSYEKSSTWDKVSVQTFIEQHPLATDRKIQQELQLQVSTLTGGLKTLDDGPNGAQYYKVRLGTQYVCCKLAENENVQFDDPLKSVDYQSDDEILLTLNSNRQIRCRRLLLAFSPSLLPTIKFSPKLPAHCNYPCEMGQCIKTIFVYSKPFWRQSPIHLCEKQGPCANIFESTNPVALIGLIVGEAAVFWSNQNEEKLIEAVTEQYSLIYNTDEKPMHTYIKCWPKEAFSRGCYASIYPPSPCSTWMDRKRALVDGKIWLASTEMALEWISYIEGAIEAGERFAQNIADSL